MTMSTSSMSSKCLRCRSPQERCRLTSPAPPRHPRLTRSTQPPWFPPRLLRTTRSIARPPCHPSLISRPASSTRASYPLERGASRSCQALSRSADVAGYLRRPATLYLIPASPLRSSSRGVTKRPETSLGLKCMAESLPLASLYGNLITELAPPVFKRSTLNSWAANSTTLPLVNVTTTLSINPPCFGFQHRASYP